MPHDIFVSYRRSDREFVATLVRRLEERGLDVWYDAEIDGGADWRDAIVDALTASSMLVVIFSDACNSSRQLKKELAVADTLGKPVVPILIEDAQPRGAYLYELADRNWLQAFPDPMDRMGEIVDHLAALAGKTAAGPAGGRPADSIHARSAAPPQRDEAEAESSAPGESAAAPAPAAPSAPPYGADRSKKGGRAPSTAPADYVGRTSGSGAPTKKLADIPPFKTIDLAILIPAWLAIAAWRIMATAGQSTPDALDRDVAFIALLCLLFAGLYGAVVFPVRYFMRGRPVLQALLRYLATSLMFLIAGAGVVLAGMDRGYMEGSDMISFLRWFAIAWAGLSVLAFLIYGAMAGQRAIAKFRSNLRKI